MTTCFPEAAGRPASCWAQPVRMGGGAAGGRWLQKGSSVFSPPFVQALAREKQVFLRAFLVSASW